MSKFNTVKLIGFACIILAISSISAAAEKAATQPAVCAGDDVQPQEEHRCFFCQIKKQSKDITPWLDLGADLRVREVYANNGLDLDSSNTTDEYHYQRYRLRTWASIKMLEMLGYTGKTAKDISVNFGLVYEPRSIERPDSKKDWFRDEVLIETLNIKYKNALGLQGLTATVGRQDIKLGNYFLVIDGTPGDGSRTFFFDAARLAYEMPENCTTVDLIYLNNHAESDAWLCPINNRDTILNSANQNEQGAIFYVSNKSLENTVIEGYFMYKHDDVIDTSVTRDIYTIGGRVAGDFADNFSYDAELAKQFGDNAGANIDALGANTQLTYHFKDELSNDVYIAYQYMSGDNDSSSSDENFNNLWARVGLWSEIYESFLTSRDGQGGASDVNLHRIGMGWSCLPTDKTILQANYHLLFADQNSAPGNPIYAGNSKFRGQLVTTQLQYTFNQHLSGRLRGEVFFPGNFYSNDNVAVFGRAEVVVKW